MNSIKNIKNLKQKAGPIGDCDDRWGCANDDKDAQRSQWRRGSVSGEMMGVVSSYAVWRWLYVLLTSTVLYGSFRNSFIELEVAGGRGFESRLGCFLTPSREIGEDVSSLIILASCFGVMLFWRLLCWCGDVNRSGAAARGGIP